MKRPAAAIFVACCCSKAQAFLPWATAPPKTLGLGPSTSGRVLWRLPELGATGGISTSGPGEVEVRPITSEDFAKNYKPVDRSGIPEKKKEILLNLPGVDVDLLVKEVPDVLFWSDKEFQTKLDVLREAMPGEDMAHVLNQCPDLLGSVDYLKDALKTLAKHFPGKSLPELLPKYPEATLGDCPRPFTYPKNLEWDVPYLDPGLMGNYSVEAGLIQAMRDSHHVVFGLWREDMAALRDFVKATKRATLAFETRVQFLREFYGDEQFARYYADDLFGETMGQIGDWVKKHPGYENYMSERLGGFQNLEEYMVRRLPPFDKEELMCKARAEGYFDRSPELEGEEGEDDGWDSVEEGVVEGQGEEEEGDPIEEAMMQALWVFDVRSGFLEKLFGPEKFATEVSRRIKAETAGTAEDFASRFPEYKLHLEQELDGWADIPMAVWEEVDVDMKEDALVEAMMIRAKALVAEQRAMADYSRPEIPRALEEAAVDSREEYLAQLDEAELKRLEALSDDEIRAHFVAYEKYLHKRFPDMFTIEGLGEPPADYVDEEEDEDTAGPNLENSSF